MTHRILRSLFVVLVGLPSASCTRTRETAAASPTTLPASRLLALDASEIDLPAVLQGRPALLNLWATWCDACRNELATLNRIDAWARGRGALVVGVAVGEPLPRVAAFTAESRLSYLVLVDEGFLLADALGSKRVPATLVIDRSGRIVHVGGAVDDRSLAALQELLGEDARPEDRAAAGARATLAP